MITPTQTSQKLTAKNVFRAHLGFSSGHNRVKSTLSSHVGQQ